MFNLEIPADKLEKFDKLMNESNVVYRIDKTNKNNSVVVIQLKDQKRFDKTQEVVRSL